MRYRRSLILSTLSATVVATVWLLGAATTLGLQTDVAQAAVTDLLFSEYVEGSSTNKALELFNGTAGPVQLEGAYDIQLYVNGNTSATATISLVGTVAPGDAFVLARAGAAAALVARVDQTTSNFLFTRDYDPCSNVVLRRRVIYRTATRESDGH
jgi:predicted extracellular nuclease